MVSTSSKPCRSKHQQDARRVGEANALKACAKARDGLGRWVLLGDSCDHLPIEEHPQKISWGEVVGYESLV